MSQRYNSEPKTTNPPFKRTYVLVCGMPDPGVRLKYGSCRVLLVHLAKKTTSPSLFLQDMTQYPALCRCLIIVFIFV